jgi:hypothetical protein
MKKKYSIYFNWCLYRDEKEKFFKIKTDFTVNMIYKACRKAKTVVMLLKVNLELTQMKGKVTVRLIVFGYMFYSRMQYKKYDTF